MENLVLIAAIESDLTNLLKQSTESRQLRPRRSASILRPYSDWERAVANPEHINLQSSFL
jgi:hypothetical protein